MSSLTFLYINVCNIFQKTQLQQLFWEKFTKILLDVCKFLYVKFSNSAVETYNIRPYCEHDVQKCFEAMIFKKILARKYIFQQSKLYQIKKFYTYYKQWSSYGFYETS